MEFLETLQAYLRDHKYEVLYTVIGFWVIIILILLIKWIVSKIKSKKSIHYDDNVNNFDNLAVNNVDTVEEDPTSPGLDDGDSLFDSLVDQINEAEAFEDYKDEIDNLLKNED